MKYTIYEGAVLPKGTQGELVSLSWEAFLEALTTNPTVTKCGASCIGHRCPEKEIEVWCPIESRNNLRGDANVLAVHALVYDVDKVSIDVVEKISENLHKYSIGAAIVGTHSYTEESPSVRVILKLTRAILPSEFKAIWNNVAKTLEIPFDPQATNIERLYYLPSVPEGRELEFEIIEGEGLDVDAIVAKTKSNTLQTPPVATPVPKPKTEVDVGELKKMVKQRNEEIFNILESEGITEGSRDSTINTVSSKLVFLLPYGTPAEAIYELMRPMLNMTRVNPGEDWHTKARDCIARALERLESEMSLKRAEAEQQKELLRQASASTDAKDDSDPEETSTDKYTVEQIATWAGEQGCPSVEAFDRRWIIHKGGTYYLFVNGRYKSGIGKDDLQNAFQIDFSRAPFEVNYMSKRGLQPTKASEILNRYGTVARNIEVNLSISKSHYDRQSETFFEAACPIRPIVPRFNKQIQTWLELMGPEVVNWVAAVSRLDKQCAALYIHAPRNTGKNLFAYGLARLWTNGGATPMNAIAHGFNDRLRVCPFVFADEKLPDIPNKSAWVRQFIGNTQHDLRKMYQASTNLSGCPRVFIAANTGNLFDTNEELTVQDLDAYAERIVYVKVSEAPGEYLSTLKQNGLDINTWVTEDIMAAHSLWLRENHKFAPGQRYLVEGKMSEFHQHLMVNSGIASHVAEWIARYIVKNTEKALHMDKEFVKWGNNEIYVSVSAMTKEFDWNEYMPAVKTPTASRIAKTLRQLSYETVDINGITYHRVQPDVIRHTIKQLTMGNTEKALRSISDETRQIQSTKNPNSQSGASVGQERETGKGLNLAN